MSIVTNKFFRVFSLVIFLLALVGIYLNYSFIPVADSWSNYELYELIENKNYLSFFSLHNEHRIVPSKLLFWVDMKFFHGTEIFLLIIHIVITLILVKIFHRIANHQNHLTTDQSSFYAYFILAMAFFWCQKANFTWAFQSQFFIVILFTILSFYALFRKWGLIPTSIFTILASISMGNGLLVPILITIYYFLNKNVSKTLFYLVLTSLICLFYFQNYQGNQSYLSPFESLVNHPFKVVSLTFIYLGNIFSFIVGKGNIGAFTAALFGAFSVFLILKNFKKYYQNPFYYFLLFVAGTAFLTALGRQQDGYLHPISSRYTTPVIYYWIMLAIIFLPQIKDTYTIHKKKINYVLVFIFFSFFINQLKVFRDSHESIQKRYVDLSIVLNNHGNILPHFTYETANSKHIKDKFVLSNAFIQKSIIPKFDLPKTECLFEVISFGTEKGKNNQYQYVSVELIDHNKADNIYIYSNNQPFGLISFPPSFTKKWDLFHKQNFLMGYGYTLPSLPNDITLIDTVTDCYKRYNLNNE